MLSFCPAADHRLFSPRFSLRIARNIIVACLRHNCCFSQSSQENYMPVVRLAGKVTGEKDVQRETRALLLYHLFRNGWDIYNSNGDQKISLSNIQKKIIEADAFVFMPGATLEDLFKAVSVFVGYQTLDADLAGKPTLILNSDGSWDVFFELLENLHAQGMIKQTFRDYLWEVDQVEAVIQKLDLSTNLLGRRSAIPRRPALTTGPSFENPPEKELQGNVCVFCSASTRDPAYLDEGYSLGKQLAENDLGCVSGAGSSGVMGAVVRGAIDAGGWTGGSNVPHIIELEGLPDGISSFWLRPDIYTRMEIMIERSDAFIVFPGGAGTVQEALALIIYKHQGHTDMMGKPIILYNRQDETGFWDPLCKLLKPWVAPDDLVVINNFTELVPSTLKAMSRLKPARAA
jgi:uncharacterized protein (TIGR00730 family)